LPPTTAATLLCGASAEAFAAAEAFLSSTGTSFNLTPDEQAAKAAVNAKIQRLRLIMKKLQIKNYR
jgi:hypothetical protein